MFDVKQTQKELQATPQPGLPVLAAQSLPVQRKKPLLLTPGIHCPKEL